MQRYAHEIVSRLAEVSGWRIRLYLPPDRVIDLAPGQRTDDPGLALAGDSLLDEQWWGGRGHLWEQTRLPRLHRSTGAELLLSPAGWGPFVVRRQLVVIFDLHPILHPEYFVAGFVRWTKLATPILTHVPRRVAVISEHVGDQVEQRLRVARTRMDVVPPAVGPPFLDRPLGPFERTSDYCLFVQGDKTQKNLDFILDFWPRVREATGLELVVTERAVGSRVAGATRADRDGVRVVVEPDDETLANLYEGALCLLWPSLAEGYGIPLLEAMAVGTPFLSADVGAARELAVDLDTQVLPLVADRWVDQITVWALAPPAGLAPLRRAGVEVARAATWHRSTVQMVEALERSLPRRR